MDAVLGKVALAALVAGGLGVATTTPVQAGSMILGNSGWRASWDPSLEDSSGSFVTLTVLAETADAVVLQKTAAFTTGPDQYGLIAPIEINFEQISSSAAKKIVITSEVVWNRSGTDWNGFKFIIEDGATGDPSRDVHFNLDESFYDGNPFDASPFKSWSSSGIAGLPQTITFSDGIIEHTSVYPWTPGQGNNPDAGEVVINANPSTTGNTRFVFKEQPLPIPLPAAAWMGLSSLAAMGAVGGWKRVRRSIA